MVKPFQGHLKSENSCGGLEIFEVNARYIETVKCTNKQSVQCTKPKQEDDIQVSG